MFGMAELQNKFNPSNVLGGAMKTAGDALKTGQVPNFKTLVETGLTKGGEALSGGPAPAPAQAPPAPPEGLQALNAMFFQPILNHFKDQKNLLGAGLSVLGGMAANKFSEPDFVEKSKARLLVVQYNNLKLKYQTQQGNMSKDLNDILELINKCEDEVDTFKTDVGGIISDLRGNIQSQNKLQTKNIQNIEQGLAKHFKKKKK